MEEKMMDSLGPKVLQEMYDKMDFRSVKEQLEKSANSTASSGDGHLELTLPSLEINDLSGSERPSPSASPELKSANPNSKPDYTNVTAEQGDHLNVSDGSSRAQIIQELKVQLTQSEHGGSNSFQVLQSRTNWDQQHSPRESSDIGDSYGSESNGSGSNNRVVTPDITPATSPEGSGKVQGQVPKHPGSSSMILSPGIPGLLPPLISSTPYIGGAASRLHFRSFSENDAIVAKQREESPMEKPFRPWERRLDAEASAKPKKGIGANLRMQRTSSLTTAPATSSLSTLPNHTNMAQQHQLQQPSSFEELNPLRRALVTQHSKLVEDLSWLQQHRPNDSQVFNVCRDYSAQVEHLERLRYQAMVMATTCPESITNIDCYYDQQRLELLRCTLHKITALKAMSFQYAMPYQVPDIPYYQGLSIVPNTASLHYYPPNYYHPNFHPYQYPYQPEPQKNKRKSDQMVMKMDTQYSVSHSQISPPLDPSHSSGSTSSSSDSAYQSLSNNSSPSSSSHDTSTSPTSSSSAPPPTSANDNLKLLEQVDKLCSQSTPSLPYEQAELRTKSVAAASQSNNKENRLLNRQAVRNMEHWYDLHFDHPYPTDQEAQDLARKGGISVAQVRKWMANKRQRSFNTLSFNGSIHPKKLRRLQQQQQMFYHQLSRAQLRYNPIAFMPRM